jgi:hypothetical protein
MARMPAAAGHRISRFSGRFSAASCEVTVPHRANWVHKYEFETSQDWGATALGLAHLWVMGDLGSTLELAV